MSTEDYLLEKFNFVPSMVSILTKLSPVQEEKTEVSKLINDLFKQIQGAVQIVEDLEGTELTSEEQQKLLQKYEKELETKNQKLTQKYVEFELFKFLQKKE